MGIDYWLLKYFIPCIQFVCGYSTSILSLYSIENANDSSRICIYYKNQSSNYQKFVVHQKYSSKTLVVLMIVHILVNLSHLYWLRTQAIVYLT